MDPLNILAKFEIRSFSLSEGGRIQGLPNFLGTP